MIEEKKELIQTEYFREIESLNRELRKFIKKNKVDIVNLVKDEMGEDDAEDMDEYLIAIKEKTNDLNIYVEDEVVDYFESVKNNLIRKGELLDIYQRIINRISDIQESIADVNNYNDIDSLINEFVIKFGDRFDKLMDDLLYDVNELEEDS